MNPCCFLWADVLEVHVGCIFHRKFIFRRILCSKLGYPARFVVTTKCFKYNVTKNRSFLPNAPHVISIWHETSAVTSAFKNLFKLGEICSQNIILSPNFEKKKTEKERLYMVQMRWKSKSRNFALIQAWNRLHFWNTYLHEFKPLKCTRHCVN